MRVKGMHQALVLVGALLIGPAAIASDQINELNTQYKQALVKNDIEQAVAYLCQAAAIDPKKYGKKCDSGRNSIADRLKEFQGNFGTGRFELQNRDYQGAIRDLSKIHFGPLHDQAQQLIGDARSRLNGAASPDDASRQSFLNARGAYEQGDFKQSLALAAAVTSVSLQPSAAQIVNNINLYNSTVAQADALVQSGRYKDAQQKYTFAAAIKSNGPGNVAEKQQKLETLLAAQQAQPVLPVPPAEMKKNNPVLSRQIDNWTKVRKALAEANAAEKSGDLKAALAGFDRALAIDARQVEALAGKGRIVSQLRGDPNALENTVTEGIQSYYASRLIQANDAISLYIHAGGIQSKGAAHFYLGATLLSQAFLADPLDHAKQDTLQQSAKREFLLAQQEKYNPIESAISPKIMTEWKKYSSPQ